MLVEGYIEFIERDGSPDLRGAITAATYPASNAGTIYYSSASHIGILFYKEPRKDWWNISQWMEEPGYKRFLWLLDTNPDSSQQYTPEQLDAMALEKYEVMPLSMNTQYYWSLYNPATPLSTPTGLYADNITSDSATTHWTGDASASNYKVQYKAAGDTVWTETYTD